MEEERQQEKKERRKKSRIEKSKKKRKKEKKRKRKRKERRKGERGIRDRLTGRNFDKGVESREGHYRNPSRRACVRG